MLESSESQLRQRREYIAWAENGKDAERQQVQGESGYASLSSEERPAQESRLKGG